MKLSTSPTYALLAAATIVLGGVRAEELSCSHFGSKDLGADPALREMIYDVGDGPQSFMAYMEPDVTSFYKDREPPASSKVVPKFNGLAGRFINISNRNLNIYLESAKRGSSNLMRNYPPFNSGGTATFPGHRFYFTPENDPNMRVKEFVIEDYPKNTYVYDPYLVEGDPKATEKNLKKNLNKKERAQYEKWRKTLSFNEQYQNFTGRSYLANYLREQPEHFMWRADYFGQEHWVTTRETHFETVPPIAESEPIGNFGAGRKLKESAPRLMQQHRVKDQATMNMTLKVLSCAPRVFEIPNFLSQAEVNHIVELASGITLSESTTGDIGSNQQGATRVDDSSQKTKTRTSKNSWVERERSTIVDAIYRRAADLMRIDEALLRKRDKTEHTDRVSDSSLSEALQLVHYGLTQEYTSHHDFGYSAVDDKHDGARYATLLLYLNEGMVGGETSFPRWGNAETFEELKVTPEAGKAILFYSQLPDGNMDDFSQHAAKPIKDGEKWLINLWVWDPVYQK